MLESRNLDLIVRREELPQSDQKALLLHICLGVVRRQFWVILFCLTLGLAAGVVYLLITPPTYTAWATMLLDSRKGGVQQKSVLGDSPADAVWIDSQVGVLTLERDKIGQLVAEKLNLATKPEIYDPGDGVISGLLATISRFFQRETPDEQGAKSESARTQQAAGAVGGGLDVKRVGFSYLVNINFSSHSQDLAVKIANAAADAYVVAEMNARYEGLRQASDWLQERYQTLRDQASTADRAVVEFKSKNNIVTSEGKLINDQQLNEINNRLGTARAHTADEEARLSQIEVVLKDQEKTGTVDTTVPDALVNPIITRLRIQYLDLLAREADWSARFGRNHLAVVNLRNQARDIRNSTHQELMRIAESYRSDLAIAKKNEAELEKQLAAIVAQIPNDAQITLRGLESSAQSYRKFYDNFLLNYTESIQQQSSPIPETRVISYASWAPKTSPLLPRVLMISILGGAVLGVGVGLLREALDRSLRTGGQVQAALKTKCLALVPQVKRRRFASRKQLMSKLTGRGINFSAKNPSWLMTEAPFSRFAESIRALKLAMDLHGASHSAKVVGLTSSVPGEGKSTIATALAGHIAQLGQSVILVDCDLRNPDLSRSLAADADAGIIDVLSGNQSLEHTIWTDSETGLTFLPAGRVSRVANTAQILASDAMKRLFDVLRLKYDYVIVDLSPLAPVVDVRATTGLIDFYFLLVKWGQTKFDVVEKALMEASHVHDNVLGVVLNKVDVRVMSRHEGHGSEYHRNKYFAKYGYSD
jgi:polysaccharide biosynthesis transport protein